MSQALVVPTSRDTRRNITVPAELTGRATKAIDQPPVARKGRNFDIRAAKAHLLGAIKSARQHELAMYQDLRQVGLAWIAICAWCDDPDAHSGKKISAHKWATENAPFGKRWLDEHADFAGNWDEFVACWKWAQGTDFAPDRFPSLRTARELMDTRKRVETYHPATATTRTTVRASPATQGTSAGKDEKLIVNPTTTVLRGDVADMMQRHVADGSIDLITVDPPYLMRVPKQPNTVDYFNALYGMTPRFREDWDQFPDIETYEAFSRRWIIEAMRCLNKQGSLFIFCSHFCVGPIARMLQVMGINIVQHIQVVKLNSRPIIKPRILQYSHYTIIWAANDGKEYQFNGYRCKQAHWSNDPFNAERGRMMRDVWLIPNSGHENKTQFPAQKTVAVFDRILTMCGKPGGTMMDVFAGSGTGAVAALRWGMQSISIEREPKYVADIIKRIQAERPPK